MAQRRMFSQKIVASDAFLEMPVSSQNLYFHLGMYADDDGFVNPKRIMRMINASEDDLKVLLGKRFVIGFENGVVVIKHWKINNLIRKDFYQETMYLEQKNSLIIKDNNAYTECLQNVNNLSPQVRLGKDSIGKVKLEEPLSPSKSLNYLKEIPREDILTFLQRFDISEKQIKDKAESLLLYCQSKGKVYKNYQAFLLNALKKDFKEKSPEGKTFIVGTGWVKKY